MPCTQGLLHSFGALRNHTIGQDIHDLIPHFVILSGSGQKLLAALLVQADSVKLILVYVPPSGHDGVGQKARHQLSPDQGLHVLRRDEILLRSGKDVR